MAAEVFQLTVWDSVGRPRYAADQLRDVVRVRDAADALMVQIARSMRKDRATWEQIGDALGMTRQGAQRFLQRAGGPTL